jgi:L-lactate dehydrogenase (cytochrome)
MLPLIRSAVGADYTLLFDSGVRNGEAVVKALALGADFVFIGRPFLYAMGADGYDGLQQMVELIRSQVDISLAQLGCTDINDIDERFILGGSAAVGGEIK